MARSLALLALAAGCALPQQTAPTCPKDGQLLAWHNDGGWTCQDSLPTPPVCDGGFAAWTGSGWTCSGFPGALAQPATCAAGELATFTNNAWACAPVTYSEIVGVPECPAGYVASTETDQSWSGTVCTKTVAGQTDEMVKVGDFWIDRFESSICGTGTIGASSGSGYGDDLWATASAVGCSVRGVQPQADTTWFQAAQMCANAGKELCTNEQWQTAVSGTPDPGTGIDGGIPYGGSSVNACNVASAGPANTMSHSDCVSAYGAYDMIGNVWERTADWGQAGVPWQMANDGEQTPPNGPWPADFGDGQDSTWNVNGRVYVTDTGTLTNGMPAGWFRGGSFHDGASAGAFAVDLSRSPTDSSTDSGARCCIGRL